jgi:Glu-tRNA(Gln) amidotransferase subunit E-like FAD-binding protein
MTPELKCGLEIHQQLATANKLFCRCSAAFQEEPSGEVKRTLHAVAGETGVVDEAAKYEETKAKNFVYRTYPSESCLVELDEEPPHKMNPDAFAIALQIAKMLNCVIPSEVEVMRKTVLDGSNTSGFQRTAIVGMDGWLETKSGRVGVQSVAVEEDACQIIDRAKNIFGMNRLGIPLVEIATAPDIKTPEQAKEVAEAIGKVLQSTERVRRGLGTIRQDLNVSIKGGERCELKGVQELSTIPKIIEYEIERQSELVKAGKKVTKDVRRVKPDLTTEFMRPMPGAARMYPETDVPPIAVTNEMLSGIRKAESIDERHARFVGGYGISADIAGQLFREGHATLFENLVKGGSDPKLAATVLTVVLKALKRDGVPVEKLGEYRIIDVFKQLGKSANKDAVSNLLRSAAAHPDKKISELMKSPESPAGALSEGDVRKEIRAIIAANPQIAEAPNRLQGAMGLVMAKLRGKAGGAAIMRILKEELGG